MRQVLTNTFLNVQLPEVTGDADGASAFKTANRKRKRHWLPDFTPNNATTTKRVAYNNLTEYVG